jgi:Carboxypeptidase regulatory-like domain
VSRIAVCAMLVLAQAISAQNGSASLSGRVVNSVTKAGIPGVELRLCRMHPPRVNSEGLKVDCDPVGASAVTDDTGSYHVTGIAEGEYAVMPAVKEGFRPPIPAPAPITISGDTHSDVELTPVATVHGRVLDSNGNPAKGVVVGLDLADCNLCTPNETKITDAEGEFVFTDVPPGDSVILTASAKFQDTQAEEKIVTTYYPSEIDRDLAERIHIQGADLFGYDIKLRSAPAHGIRGIVLDAAGHPVPKALVSIVKPATGLVAGVRGVFSSPPVETPVAEPAETLGEGTFTFPPVMRGDWMLRAVVTVRGLPAQAGSAEVKVADAEVEGVTIRLAPALDIEIETDFGDSPPATPPATIPPLWPTMIPLDSPRLLPLPPGDLQPGETPRFKGFAGKYFVGPTAGLAGYYLAAALVGKHDVLGQVTDIAAGDTIKLVFRKDGGSVRGNVEQGAGALVVLMANDPGSGARLGYSGHCDASGAFTIADIPPGEYTAVAGKGFPDFGSADFAGMLTSSGKRVRVEAGSTAQADLRLAVQ